MRKRELLVGFGAGMIVAAAITGWYQAKQVPSSTRALSSDQIKNAAKELQMVVLTKEEYEQWQQEKKVNVKPAPTSPKAPTQPQAPVSKQTSIPQAPAAGKEETTTPQISVQPASATVTPTPVHNPAPPTVEVPQIEKQVSFTVPYKATAEGVAKQLVEAGILSTDNKFVDELRNQDKLGRIRVGTYQISAPATEAQIVKLITTPPKK